MKNQLKAVKTKLEVTLRYQTKDSLTWNSKTHQVYIYSIHL